MKHIVKSIPRKGRLNNGDNFIFYEDESVIIAAVADGVGGNACDWISSEQACHDLVGYFVNEYGHLGTKAGIAYSLMKTYTRIYATKGECEGMLSTLVSIILDKATNQYFYFGIGDSLILKFENDTVEELTPESDFRMQPELLFQSVSDGGYLNSDTAFALMTDGISDNRKNFKSELALVLHSEEWETKLEQIMQLNQLTQFDDMTLMLLKN